MKLRIVMALLVLLGGLATSLVAHRDLGNAAHRAEIEKLWGVEHVPSAPGLTAVELFDAVKRGQVKIVWIACTNPAQSLPDLPNVRAAEASGTSVVPSRTTAASAPVAFGSWRSSTPTPNSWIPRRMVDSLRS